MTCYYGRQRSRWVPRLFMGVTDKNVATGFPMRSLACVRRFSRGRELVPLRELVPCKELVPLQRPCAGRDRSLYGAPSAVVHPCCGPLPGGAPLLVRCAFVCGARSAGYNPGPTSCPALLPDLQPDLQPGPLSDLLSGRRQPRAGAATGETYACNGIRRAERGTAPRQLFILVKHFRNRTAIPRASPMSNRFGRSSDWLLFRSLPGTRPVAEMFGMLRSFTAAGLSGNCTRFPFHPRLRKGASEPNLREQI